LPLREWDARCDGAYLDMWPVLRTTCTSFRAINTTSPSCNIPTLHRSTLTSLLYDEIYQLLPLSISRHLHLSLTYRRSSSLSHTGNSVSRRRTGEGNTNSLYRPQHSLKDSTEVLEVAWSRMQSQQDPEGPPVTDQQRCQQSIWVDWLD
jgi:hypothetical protein